MFSKEEAKQRHREANRRYREANREKLAEQSRQYRALNPAHRSETSRRYYKAHRDEIIEKTHQYREANPDYTRRYYEANRGKIAEKARRYNEVNREKVAEAKRRHYEANRVKISEKVRIYREGNRKAYSEKSRLWAKANPEKRREIRILRRARIAGAEGSHTEAQWQALCSYYMDQCLCCGEVPDLLTRDHIVPLSMGGTDYIENIQPLCGRCNSGKGTKTIDYRVGTN